MVKAIGVILCFFIGNYSLRAQSEGSYSLKECIDIAVQQSALVKQAKISLAQNESQAKTQKLNFLPTANLTGSHSYNFGRSIDRYSNEFVNTTIRNNYFSLNTGLMLYNGMQNQNNLQMRNYNVQAAENGLATAQNDIALQVSNLFLQAMLAKENITIAQNQILQTQLQLERTKKLYTAGSIDQGQVLTLEAQLANDDFNLSNAQNNLQSAKLSLRSLLLLKATESFELSSNDSMAIQPLPITDIAVIYANALSAMPQIAQAEAQVKSAEASYRATLGARAPSINAYANLSTVYSGNAKEITSTVPTGTQTIAVVKGTNEEVIVPTFQYNTQTIGFAEQAKSNFGQSVGVQANIPIFNGNQVNNAILNSETNLQLTKLNAETLKQQLYNDIATAVFNANASYNKYEAAKKSSLAQEQSNDFSEKRYTAGLLNYYDYNNARNLYLNAINNLQSAKYEYLFRKMIVDFYQDNTWKF